ncbi:MAG TPA: hypothetical protein PKE54_11900 [Candidatus Obscuribacter sp.]|nr:hypothetical protein [Candidatus Obscuribacter sp.]
MNNKDDEFWDSIDSEILMNIVKAAYSLQYVRELLEEECEPNTELSEIKAIERDITNDIRTRLMPAILKIHPVERDIDRLTEQFRYVEGVEINLPQAKLMNRILEESNFVPVNEREQVVFNLLKALLGSFINVCQSKLKADQ